MKLIHKVAIVIGLAAVTLTGTAGGAQAAAPAVAVEKANGVAVATQPTAGPTSLAASCPSGNLCIWDGVNGTGNRCTWYNSDNDWWNTPVVCSWSDDRPVRSAWNAGTSSNWGVWIHDGANYTTYNNMMCLRQQSGLYNLSFPVKYRSHRWMSSVC